MINLIAAPETKGLVRIQPLIIRHTDHATDALAMRLRRSRETLPQLNLTLRIIRIALDNIRVEEKQPLSPSVNRAHFLCQLWEVMRALEAMHSFMEMLGAREMLQAFRVFQNLSLLTPNDPVFTGSKFDQFVGAGKALSAEVAQDLLTYCRPGSGPKGSYHEAADILVRLVGLPRGYKPAQYDVDLVATGAVKALPSPLVAKPAITIPLLEVWWGRLMEHLSWHVEHPEPYIAMGDEGAPATMPMRVLHLKQTGGQFDKVFMAAARDIAGHVEDWIDHPWSRAPLFVDQTLNWNHVQLRLTELGARVADVPRWQELTTLKTVPPKEAGTQADPKANSPDATAPSKTGSGAVPSPNSGQNANAGDAASTVFLDHFVAAPWNLRVPQPTTKAAILPGTGINPFAGDVTHNVEASGQTISKQMEMVMSALECLAASTARLHVYESAGEGVELKAEVLPMIDFPKFTAMPLEASPNYLMQSRSDDVHFVYDHPQHYAKRGVDVAQHYTREGVLQALKAEAGKPGAFVLVRVVAKGATSNNGGGVQQTGAPLTPVTDMENSVIRPGRELTKKGFFDTFSTSAAQFKVLVSTLDLAHPASGGLRNLAQLVRFIGVLGVRYTQAAGTDAAKSVWVPVMPWEGHYYHSDYLGVVSYLRTNDPIDLGEATVRVRLSKDNTDHVTPDNDAKAELLLLPFTHVPSTAWIAQQASNLEVLEATDQRPGYAIVRWVTRHEAAASRPSDAIAIAGWERGDAKLQDIYIVGFRDQPPEEVPPGVRVYGTAKAPTYARKPNSIVSMMGTGVETPPPAAAFVGSENVAQDHLPLPDSHAPVSDSPLKQ